SSGFSARVQIDPPGPSSSPASARCRASSSPWAEVAKTSLYCTKSLALPLGTQVQRTVWGVSHRRRKPLTVKRGEHSWAAVAGVQLPPTHTNPSGQGASNEHPLPV